STLVFEVWIVHVIASGDEMIVPSFPTATNAPRPNATELRSAVAPVKRPTHAPVFVDVKQLPASPTRTYVPWPNAAPRSVRDVLTNCWNQTAVSVDVNTRPSRPDVSQMPFPNVNPRRDPIGAATCSRKLPPSPELAIVLS